MKVLKWLKSLFVKLNIVVGKSQTVNNSEKYQYTITIDDGFRSNTYHFESDSGNYSIEFLAGMFANANHDLTLIK